MSQLLVRMPHTDIMDKGVVTDIRLMGYSHHISHSVQEEHINLIRQILQIILTPLSSPLKLTRLVEQNIQQM